jgi:hypothetical protein
MQDLLRYGQNGYYSGTLVTPEDGTIEVDGTTWRGYRDRSWGVRPVGEREPQGIQKTTKPNLMWLYCAAQFRRREPSAGGVRSRQERPDPDRGPPRADRARPRSGPDKRLVTGGVLRCPNAPGGPLEVGVEAILPLYLMVGTGYFLEDDGWVHGSYMGPEWTDCLTFDIAAGGPEITGMIDGVGRFQLGDEVGHGLFEYGFIGSFSKYGLAGDGYWNAASRSDTGAGAAPANGAVRS